MKSSSLQACALSKIAGSLEKASTLEQLLSTKQFLALYYNQFDFQCQYLLQEWKIDTLLREKTTLLSALEGGPSLAFELRKPSLKRLEAYVKTIFQKQFESEWSQLQTQLAEVSVVEMSHYSLFCQLMSTLTPPSYEEEWAFLLERDATQDQPLSVGQKYWLYPLQWLEARLIGSLFTQLKAILKGWAAFITNIYQLGK